ncbi:MAG: molybdate ABC transporter substrate-binding protein [Hydrogenovibrio sp.]|uniref:molybdate ABC transporter substrate-binding protein n=1 Tax=Hydrogenovibrio sp. TaxID=2065821 RepID=UPI00287043FF|nr:molybdate ABC transporter substrate-binding protein [Hydrogenovibrio sp.]MDR9499402.1 molybdate ABC transporter substrate-binding protein [Hydrogenovibrio sp.]
MSLIKRFFAKALFGLSVTAFSLPAFSESATIAVAANFTKTIEVIGEAFEKETGHELKFSFGPTGKLYAQISNGAPFDMFFGADERRPKKTIDDGIGLADSYFVYAQGQIVLYSDQYPVKAEAHKVLKDAQFKHLAVANPKNAPYGNRAVEFLKGAGLYAGVEKKLVYGESIAHAFQYVATGNAPIGFVAMSQVVDPESPIYEKGEYWVVPADSYTPINQGALVLKRGQDNAAIAAFVEFLKTDTAKDIIQRFGYRTP